MRKKNNLVLRLASLLLVCVLISTYTLCGLLARYTSSGSGSDSARVIKFGDITITETGDFKKENNTNQFIVIPGVNLTKDIHVSFSGSEAATYVFIKMNVSNPWEFNSSNENEFMINEDMKFSVVSNWTYVTNKDNDYVYSIELDPNETLDEDVISENGLITVSSDITKANISDFNSTIDVKAYVVQKGGFSSAQEAWNSISSKY